VSWGRAGHGESQERDREHRDVQVAQQLTRRIGTTPELFLKRSTKLRGDDRRPWGLESARTVLPASDPADRPEKGEKPRRP